MPKPNGRGPVDSRPPLTDRQKQLMLLGLVRHKEAFAAAVQRLSSAHFSDYDRGYALVWQAAVDCYEAHQELPNQELLMTEVERRIEQGAEEWPDEELRDLEMFIESIYLVPYEQLQPSVSTRLCKQFLQDRLVSKAREALREDRDIPVDLREYFAEMASEADTLQALDAEGVTVPFGETWSPRPLVKTDVGLSYLNDYLKGGQVAGECYGLMGPIGSCKTTIGICLSVEGARTEYAKWEANGREGKLGVWFYAQYEEPIDPDILMRAIGYTGTILRDRLEDADPDTFSTGSDHTTLQEYEKKIYGHLIQQQGPYFNGERERFALARLQLQHNWRPIDMSGCDSSRPNQGHGLVPELASVITNYINKHPNEYVAGVVIDHVNAACERHIAHHNKDHSELRHLVGKFPLHAKRMIAGQMNCPVWCLHQVSGEANAKSPGTVLHFTDSAESKAFAEFLNVCFTVGNKNKDNLCTLALRKGRRLPARDPTIIEIDGAFNRVLNRNAEYTLDNGHIVLRSEYNRLADVPMDDRPTTPDRPTDRPPPLRPNTTARVGH